MSTESGAGYADGRIRPADERIDLGAVVGAVFARLPRILILTLLVLGATYAVLSVQPRLYESTAAILVEPRTNIYAQPNNTQAVTLPANDASIVSSQIELMRSRDTLLRVVDRVGLRDVAEFNGSDPGFSPFAVFGRILGRPAPVGGDSIVLSNLLERLTIIQQRDSRVISIAVRARDPELAARIANAIAEAHVMRRVEQSISDTATASGWLEEEIENLRVSVADAEAAVAEFRVENDLIASSGNNATLLDQQLSTLSSQVAAAQERRNTAESRAATIRNLIASGGSSEGIQDVQASAVIQQLTQERARLQGERAQLSATYLPNHPNIRALTAQIGELDAQIRLEGQRIASALEAQAATEANLEASLREELDGLRANASTATRDNVTLQGLIREADAQRDLLESYLRRYSEAVSRTDANSAFPDVRVVTEAAPAITPSWPQTTLVLVAVGIVMIAGQVGIIIFAELVSGRALAVYRRPEYASVGAVPVAAAPASQPSAPPPSSAAPLVETDGFVVAPHTPETAEPEGDLIEKAVASRPRSESDRLVMPVVPAPARQPVAPTPPVETARDEIVEAEAGRVDQSETASADPADDVWMIDEDDDIEILLEDIPAPEADETVVDETPAQPMALAPLAALAGAQLDRLASDLAEGNSRILVLAGVDSSGAPADLAETLADDMMRRGLSVALIDAGSGRVGDSLGVADLSMGAASFGDVVYKSADDSFVEVPWGQVKRFDRRSKKPVTLVEALSDIYEIVLVSAGRVGSASTLPVFKDISQRLVLVANDATSEEAVAGLKAELSEAGWPEPDLVRTAPPAAA